MVSVSHLSDFVTQQTNVTGTTTPILEIQPENGTMLRFRDRVGQGSEKGIPVVMKLKDAGGNELPTDTEVIFRVLRPTDDEPVPVSQKEDNIAAWNGLSTKEQRNEENIDQTKMNLKGDRVNVRDKDVLRVEANSSTAIDWGNSEFYFGREAVEELPYEG
ncbi:hypothetical protein [Haloarchaeobius sp. HME9146]|uniref:hypothetical protein n=1 Tax=Haloarchaeobius sp. HME9146 TaxID=2978732 RepID=UPI0021C1F9EF|nr:hypothetical protein [Haloarchaeobius sp. HME9146]MCT9095277.1 hypothetical protein [Haloarchaeobius sp. HME9146]